MSSMLLYIFAAFAVFRTEMKKIFLMCTFRHNLNDPCKHILKVNAKKVYLRNDEH